MTTLQEQIAVMQYFANGGQVEYRNNGTSTWSFIPNPCWDWSINDYRIAQPPKRKMWQWILQQDNGCIFIGAFFYATKEEAQRSYKPTTVIKPALWTEIEL